MPPRNIGGVPQRRPYNQGLDVRRNLVNAALEDIVGQIATTVDGATSIESEMLRFMGVLFADQAFMRQYGAEVKQVHEEVGRQAVLSMANAYTHRRFRRTGPSYRKDDTGRNQRYAGGALRAALFKGPHVQATPQGLRFINADYLDKEAKQWRRLNYGAGGKAGQGGGSQQFEISWGGLVAATLGLPNDTRPAFRIPRGYWFNANNERVGAGAGTNDRFFPVSSSSGEMPRPVRGRPSPGRVTAGIAGAHFLDAGVRRIANELPYRYIDLYRSFYDRILPRLQKAAQTAGTTVAPRNEVQLVISYTRDRAPGGGFRRRTYQA